jgi:hypothetical protein
MITEFFLSLATSVLGWLADLFPTWDDTSALDSFPAVLSTVMGWFVGLGVWVDWGILTGCVAVQMIVTLGVFSIKGLRAAASHIPFFGGSGA